MQVLGEFSEALVQGTYAHCETTLDFTAGALQDSLSSIRSTSHQVSVMTTPTWPHPLLMWYELVQRLVEWLEAICTLISAAHSFLQWLQQVQVKPLGMCSRDVYSCNRVSLLA